MELKAIHTLLYNNDIVGYRLIVKDKGNCNFYDIDKNSATKYNIVEGLEGKELVLYDVNGVLMTETEDEVGLLVEDKSTDTNFLIEISRIKNTL